MSAPALSLDDLKPAVDDVAMLLRTRTVGPPDPNAGGLGGDTGPSDYTTFDDTTRPTDVEVQMIIDASTGTIWSRLDMSLGELQEWQTIVVRHASALYAAILVEVSFFKESVNQALLDMWRSMIDQALAGVAGAGGAGAAVHHHIGSLKIESSVPSTGWLYPADFMPGIDDANYEGYWQPLLAEVVTAAPPDYVPGVTPLHAPRRT